MRSFLAFLIAVTLTVPAAASPSRTSKIKPKSAEPAQLYKASTFEGLTLRSIGPALTSGRIADVAIDPDNHDVWYVAAASGGVWKTVNAGTTFTPIFDHEGSYSIGCVTVDPNDPLTVWVGTGENNSQRSVSYGDGIYKSIDGGRHWKNVGLKTSEHIAKILVDPRNSNVIYVAAQGPLWNPGGDRGLYKSIDGGKTWKDVLKISANTGVTDVVFDPRDSDTLYAAAYQRRRRQWTLIDGGPESAIYKSSDAGAHWTKLTNGLPKVNLGRIGLAISPASPDTVYAIIEAANGKSGFFRSQDGGGSWNKTSDYRSTSPQYYQEIIADPKDPNRIYSMDTWMKVSEDGGKTFHNVGEKSKHVDNHALWIDPTNTNHLIAGCDGGLYESHDRGATWRFFANLPVTQFYNVAIGLDAPFYHVYGGTQDNNTLGGPARTAKQNGIANSDWFVTVGGDGFQSQVDPKDPDIVYSESQYGGLVRFDRKNGEAVDIQPQPAPGQPALRFNWNSPIIISPHSHTRLYFAAQQVFQSEDRGDSWHPISPDLTRQIDRNKLKIMGKVWSVDAVAKNASTSFYGSIVALAESPVQTGLIYAGTDDGLLQVTSDDGKSWIKIDRFPGIPEMTMVADIEPSHANADTVYVAFDNHKSGDFAPYLLRSTDRGKTWSSIVGDLPHRGSVHAVIEDPKDPDLLFAGTEFGLFFTPDLGHHWIQLKGGMPTIAVRDLAIQPQMDDLVAATFGRGFYVLDNIEPLREVTSALLAHDATFPVRKALTYIPRTPLGDRGKAGEGDAYYLASNPPFGAVFTYYLKNSLESLKEQRRAREKKELEKTDTASYPTWSELRKEAREEKPSVVMVVSDSEGHIIRRLEGPVKEGFHRVAWDLRYPPSTPVTTLKPKKPGRYDYNPMGPMVVPGTYHVSFFKKVQGKETPFGEEQSFTAEAIGTSSLPPTDRAALLTFEHKTAKLERAVLGATSAAKDANHHLALVERALRETPQADRKLYDRAHALRLELDDIEVALRGDPVLRKHNAPQPPSIVGRVEQIVYGHWTSTSAPTETERQSYQAAVDSFTPVLARLRKVIEVDIKQLDGQLEAVGAPWTPGRVPTFSPQ